MQNPINQNLSATQAIDARFGEEADMARLSSLKTLRRNTGLTLGFWADISEGLDQGSLHILETRSQILIGSPAPIM